MLTTLTIDTAVDTAVSTAVNTATRADIVRAIAGVIREAIWGFDDPDDDSGWYSVSFDTVTDDDRYIVSGEVMARYHIVYEAETYDRPGYSSWTPDLTQVEIIDLHCYDNHDMDSEIDLAEPITLREILDQL